MPTISGPELVELPGERLDGGAHRDQVGLGGLQPREDLVLDAGVVTGEARDVVQVLEGAAHEGRRRGQDVEGVHSVEGSLARRCATGVGASAVQAEDLHAVQTGLGADSSGAARLRSSLGCAILSAVIRLLFVCMGNICRSPTAEGVMRGLLREQGLEDRVEVDSAGTGAGTWATPRMRAPPRRPRRAAVTLAGAARTIAPADFTDFDLILVADRRNLRDVRAVTPPEVRARIHLLREFDPDSAGAPDLDVPDPYYGGPDGFEQVLDLVEAACRGLLDDLRAHHRL